MITDEAKTPGMKKRMIQHAKELLKKVPGARWYKFGDREWLATAAILTSYQEERRAAGKNFDPAAATEFLAELVEHLPSLKQQRPGNEPEVPQLPTDPVTGAVPPNPWSKGSLNLEDQAFLAKNKPAVASYMQTMANGLTFKGLHQQQEEATARAVLRSLVYSAAEHEANPLRGSDLPAKAKFHKEHHPAVVQFFQREADDPVSLFWLNDNLTERMALAKSAPHLQMLADPAAELIAAWGADELQTLRGEETELARKRAVAESLLKPSLTTHKP